MQQSSFPDPPEAKRKDKKLTEHGDTRTDPYFWLNDRDNPEVLAYLEAENEYAGKVMKSREDLQEQLFQEIVGRIKQDDDTVPFRSNGYFYFSKYQEGREYAVHLRRPEEPGSPEEVLIDVNEQAEGKAFYQLGGLTVSPDNRLMCFGEDVVGRRLYSLRFRDLTTGAYLEDRIPNTGGKAVWATDSKTVFYTKKDETTLRPDKVFRHILGTDPTEDAEVFHEADEMFYLSLSKTKDRKYILLGSYSKLTTEYHYLASDQPKSTFQRFQPRDRDAELEYYPDHLYGQWYIRTNWKAKNFRLMKTAEDQPGIDNWEQVIPHREEVLLEDFELFHQQLVLAERRRGITLLAVYPWDGEPHYIDFEEEAYLAYIENNREPDTTVLRIGYESMTTPNTIYDYDMEARTMTLLKRQEVVGDFQPKNYRTERLFAEAGDGTEVPISLVYRKDKRSESGNPLLLYGYGSYGISIDPYFSAHRLSLLDRGFIFAAAHIRGGEEMGRHWYEDGKLLNKKNTFTDFIDCAEYLLQKGFARTGQLYAIGGSAGGMLMGVVANERPDLWKGIVSVVPFLDVLTTMLDDSIPLTTGEYDEWGNPHEEKYYKYIKSYSPYDNLEAKPYPAMLVMCGLHDSQVQYWEPAKYVAKLRTLKTDGNILLLHTNLEAGHGGSSGRFRRHRETALQYAFLLALAEE